MISPYQITGQPLHLEDIATILASGQPLALAPSSLDRIKACREYLDRKLEGSNELIYGINTGFGGLSDVRISNDQVRELQENLVLSHAAGTGEEVPAGIVRLMLLLKIHALSLGYSGAHPNTVLRLMDFYNQDMTPSVFQLGSLGASGDLAPLAHLSLPLIGRGELQHKGKKYPSADLLRKQGWEPLQLHSKEGLALLNGTQFMSAYGVHACQRAHRLVQWADTIAALSCEAFHCRLEPFWPHTHRLRPHPGQVATAAALMNLFEGSEMAEGPRLQVQDPYSFRCIPQVHGATKDTLAFASGTITTEINSVTDNPILFPDEDLIISGGNFHGQPLALVMDYLAIAMGELGNVSERRIYLLVSGQRGLPPFLVKQAGLHSGLMIAQYTAAAIVSQNKQLCTPASADSITSSNGQEDHVSMGANSATKLAQLLGNLERVLAIELLTAAQALDFRRPRKTSLQLEELHAAFRAEVPFMERDREIYLDIDKSLQFLQDYPLPLKAMI